MECVFALLNFYGCLWVLSQVNDIHLADVWKVTPTKFSGPKEGSPLYFRKPVCSYFVFIFGVSMLGMPTSSKLEISGPTSGTIHFCTPVYI